MTTIRWRAAVGAVAALVVLTACGDETGPDNRSASSPTHTSPARPQTLNPAECLREPAKSRIDRVGHDLAFRHGSIKVSVGTTSTPGAAPATPGATRCYTFDRWGPPEPGVPPDSMLFVFKSEGADGAQLEFLVSELTGGVLPPIGDVRPRVGPLTAPINAQIGVAVDGRYHHSTSCRLTIAGMSTKRAAGHFDCPSASLSDANPFAPDDDVPYDADDSTTPTAPPGQPVPPAQPPQPPAPPTSTTPETSTVTLRGWFELTP